MSEFDQIPYDAELPSPALPASDFIDNPEPRLPYLLLLDTSRAMSEATLRDLENGLNTLIQDVRTDALAAKRLDIATVTFGPVQALHDFVHPDHFVMPHLQVGDDAPLGGALRFALDLIEARKTLYKVNGLAYYRPTILLITAAVPTDDWRPALQRLRAAEQARKVTSFVLGAPGSDLSCLQEITAGGRPPINGAKISETFLWLSRSHIDTGWYNIVELVDDLGSPIVLPPVDWDQV